MALPISFFRIISTLLVVFYVCCSFADEIPTNNFEIKSVFPLNYEDRKAKEATMKKRSFSDSETEQEKHERKRRQSFCEFHPSCPTPLSLYRSIDGTCNNLNHSRWGSTFQPYVRFLPPVYEDGYQAQRGYMRPTNQLPNSRLISVQMVNTFVVPKPENVTVMVMQFGQFLDHDMALTSNDGDATGIYSNAFCCDDFMSNFQGSPSCFPIDVSSDWFYQQFNVRCLPFIRSTDTFCWFQREQRNEVTAYLDANQVYGSDSFTQSNLRESSSWKLKSGPGSECTNCQFAFLPVQPNANTGEDEFIAGDKRVEQQPGLTSLHTVFVRLHNIIGQLLKTDHPNWTDDKIYEETRKIIGALLAQITYNEFLPIVLGPAKMNERMLTLQNISLPSPYFNGYNDTVDATLPNVVPTAAFRFGHSLIPNKFNVSGTNVKLQESFNTHNITTLPGKFPSHFMKSVCTQNAEEMDHVLSSSVHSWLFSKFPFDFGSDLYARNIERGRDHGLPAYSEWLNTCRPMDKKITRFSELHQVMPNETVDALRSIYGERLQEVDLFPAGIAETNLPNALVGPTFACILAEFFFRLKIGDRFWFENPNVFTIAQLKAIRSTTLSMILCITTDSLQLQDKVMLPVSASNPLKFCSTQRTLGIFANFTTNW